MSSGVNKSALDRFSFVHFGAGFAIGKTAVSAEAAAAGAVVFELLENPAKVQFPSAFPNSSPDTAQNSLADVAVFLAGFWLSRLS
jgi:hypothetical protein